MYQGKRLAAESPYGYRPKRLAGPGKRLRIGPRHTNARKLVCGMTAAAALCALAFTGAADLSTAYLHDLDSVDNAFVPGSVNPSVEETFDETTKENVTIRNNGNTPVYIRALWIVSWKDAEGKNVLSGVPVEETDYTAPVPEAGWSLGSDGYYYYTRPVQPGGATSKLIQSLTLTDSNTDPTRRLSVDIIAQAVQASPAEAVTDVFQGVSVGPDGTLEPPASGGGTT